jgi:hypothetical protein
VRCAYGARDVSVSSAASLVKRAAADMAAAMDEALDTYASGAQPHQARRLRSQRTATSGGALRARVLAAESLVPVDRMLAPHPAHGGLVPLAQLPGYLRPTPAGDARSLYASASDSSGARTFLALRTRWSDSTDASAVPRSVVDAGLTLTMSLLSRHSYGAMRPLLANTSGCVYTLAGVSSTNNADWTRFLPEAAAAALIHPVPACRFDASAFQHVMVIHQSAPLGYAGLGACPGSLSQYNGGFPAWVGGLAARVVHCSSTRSWCPVPPRLHLFTTA